MDFSKYYMGFYFATEQTRKPANPVNYLAYVACAMLSMGILFYVPFSFYSQIPVLLFLGFLIWRYTEAKQQGRMVGVGITIFRVNKTDYFVSPVTRTGEDDLVIAFPVTFRRCYAIRHDPKKGNAFRCYFRFFEGETEHFAIRIDTRDLPEDFTDAPLITADDIAPEILMLHCFSMSRLRAFLAGLDKFMRQGGWEASTLTNI
jgi:hypothetical protein